MKAKKNIPLSLRIEEQLYEKLSEISEKEDRSISSLSRKAIEKYIETMEEKE